MYIAGQVPKTLLLQYPDKIEGQQAVSEKAQIIYRAVDAHPEIYSIIPDKTVRSRMNIFFRMKSGDAAEEAFLKEGNALGRIGLRGHRSLRGICASNDNAVPFEGAQKLASIIEAFASRSRTSAGE